MAQQAPGLKYRRFEKYAPKLHASLGTLSLGLKLKHLGSKTVFNCIYFKATTLQAPGAKMASHAVALKTMHPIFVSAWKLWV
jgi:hypothetical protein